ncbi:MAG TPA: AIR synthase-related protein, partial [Terriglobales bacterium]|nr:AIR synthase-related protein [Terriglobales bacterium]
TCEMGARGHVGIEIELDLVHQRETGMSAYEIMLSESQERMLLVAEKGREEEVARVFQKWGLDAVTVGRVTSDGKLRVLQHSSLVAEIPNSALTDEAPVYNRPMERWETPVPRELPDGVSLDRDSDLAADLKALLASPNICSKRWITEQYESYVQLTGVQRPGGDAGVIRVKGTDRGLAMALDGNGRWCWLDPRLGAMHAVAEAARNVACTGATPAAATNCLNFGNPEKPHIMWQFSQVIDGMRSACEELEIPITGGNVSFYNETLGEGIYPTPVLGVVGLLENLDRMKTPHFQSAGRSIVLLRASEPGDLTDAEIEFGSSEYAREILGQIWGFPPALELEKEAALQRCVVEIIGAGLADSAHDCSEGGLAVALAESGFLNNLGARVDLPAGDLPPAYVLFGEDASRIVLSCDPAHVAGIKETAGKHGVAADLIGETQTEKLDISMSGNLVVSAPISELKSAWASALEKALHTETAEHLVPEILEKS